MTAPVRHVDQQARTAARTGISPVLGAAAVPPEPSPTWSAETTARQLDAWAQAARLGLLPAEELAREIAVLFAGDSADLARERHKGVLRVCKWLAPNPGDTWQDRWDLGGADSTWLAFYRGHTTSGRRLLCKGVEGLVVSRTVRPGIPWLVNSQRTTLVLGRFLDVNDAEWRDRLVARAQDEGQAEYVITSMLRLVLQASAHTGKVVPALAPADLVTIRQHPDVDVRTAYAGYTYTLLLRVGVFPVDSPPTLRAAAHGGQRTVEQLVDRYRIRNPWARDAFVAYLRERQPSVTYGTLDGLARNLCGLFWRTVEDLAPGVSTFHLNQVVVDGWKARLPVIPARAKQPSRPRSTAEIVAVKLAVRAFYFDINEWAHEEPERWAHLTAPCPVRQSETLGATDVKKAQKQHQDKITRRLGPRLPVLRATALARVEQSRRLLDAGSAAGPGSSFDVDGTRYLRLPATKLARVRVTTADDPDKVLDLTWAEEDAFWCWAVIEVLTLIGSRCEELLELTALDLVPYAPTGEPLPLLHINPAKTRQERLFPLMPHEADVFAAIIRRVSIDGLVPLVARYDGHERMWSPMLPHLFQRQAGGSPQVFSAASIASMITRTAELAGIPERFTPHNFRRLFVTEKINSGFPIHLVAKLAGHERIETTQGYAAVYPEHVIEGFRRHLKAMRETRPPEEYRTPTEAEVKDFNDHFGKRRVRLGRCNRSYGTDCPREHTCHRCPLLAVADQSEELLLRMERDFREAIERAEQDGLLGEVEGLNADLQGVADRLAVLRQRHAAEQVTGTKGDSLF